MTEQLVLLRAPVARSGDPVRLPPTSHAADPITSLEAEHAVTASGARGRQLALVVDAVRQHPGLTAEGIASACGLDRYQAMRRLSDAKHAGLARQGEPREQASGRRAMTWWPL
jgi:hypothetical protein